MLDLVCDWSLQISTNGSKATSQKLLPLQTQTSKQKALVHATSLSQLQQMR